MKPAGLGWVQLEFGLGERQAAHDQQLLQQLLPPVQPRQQPRRNVRAVGQRLQQAPVPQQLQPQLLDWPAS